MAVGVDLPILPPLNLLQVNTGLQPDDGLGDTWFNAFAKHNENMEKISLFAQRVETRFEEMGTQITQLTQQYNQLSVWLQNLINQFNNLPPIPDLTDILARLAVLEAFIHNLPSGAYQASQLPYIALGFGKPLTAKVPGFATGTPVTPYNTKALGLASQEVLIRAVMFNAEWDAGQDQRINTGQSLDWEIFFSHKVKAEAVLNTTFTNQYTGTGNPATLGTQTKKAIDPLGNEIAQWSSAVTYAQGAIVANAANIVGASTKWFRSKTNGNTNNALPASGANTHWEELTDAKRWYRFRVTVTCTSSGGERFVKLGFPPTAEIPEFLDNTGRKAVMPCLDRGLVTVVAA